MSDDFDAVAARLYPSSAPADDAGASAPAVDPVAAQQARGAAISEQAAASKAETARKEAFAEHGLWKPPSEVPKVEVPDAIAALRNTPERRMFSADAFSTHVDTDALISASPLADMTPAQLEALKPAVVSELHAMYTDSGLTHEEAQLVERVIVDMRANRLNESPEADAANRQTAERQLVERYGKDAQAALDDARAFVKRDPRIAKMLDTGRGGNDPRMVLLAVEAARRARARGEQF